MRPFFLIFYCSPEVIDFRGATKLIYLGPLHVRVAKFTWGASKALLSLTHNYLTRLESRADAHIAVAVDGVVAHVPRLEGRAPRAARSVL